MVPMPPGYIHGTDPGEIARLEEQAEFVGEILVEGVELPAAPRRLLDLGCGVGAMTPRQISPSLPPLQNLSTHSRFPYFSAIRAPRSGNWNPGAGAAGQAAIRRERISLAVSGALRTKAGWDRPPR